MLPVTTCTCTWVAGWGCGVGFQGGVPGMGKGPAGTPTRTQELLYFSGGAIFGLEAPAGTLTRTQELLYLSRNCIFGPEKAMREG